MVDVYWLEQSVADLPVHDHWLSAEEAFRLRSLRFSKRQSEWRLGRWTVKQAVCAYQQIRPDSDTLALIEVRPEASGAPLLFVGGEPAAASVSISHRDGVSFCAIAPDKATLGCDLERIEPRSDSFAADFFTSDEYRAVHMIPLTERAKLVTLIWSAKESALKALHAGLTLDTRSVEVVPPNALQTCTVDTWHPLLIGSGTANVFHGWWQLADGFVRTLVSSPAPFAPLPVAAMKLAHPVRLIA